MIRLFCLVLAAREIIIIIIINNSLFLSFVLLLLVACSLVPALVDGLIIMTTMRAWKDGKDFTTPFGEGGEGSFSFFRCGQALTD